MVLSRNLNRKTFGVVAGIQHGRVFQAVATTIRFDDTRDGVRVLGVVGEESGDLRLCHLLLRASHKTYRIFSEPLYWISIYLRTITGASSDIRANELGKQHSCRWRKSFVC